MSRKNNQSKRRNQHAYDLKCEKSLLLAKKVASEKKAAKSKSKLSQKGGEVNKVKRRGVRVKKGVRIKGIKIQDSASKKKALELLKAEQEMRMMDVEEAAPEEIEEVVGRKKPSSKSFFKADGKRKDGIAPMAVDM